jgi:hypothetical protein
MIENKSWVLICLGIVLEAYVSIKD